jgi:tetratricopeptide (TPR) repeat protein
MLPAPGVERHSRASRLEAVQARADLGEALAAAGERFSDERLVERAIANLSVLAAGLDAAYEPLSWARTTLLKGRALIVLGELTGEVGQIVEGVGLLTEILELIARDHSPLDWAAAQLELAHGLHSLAEASDGDGLDRAVAAYDRALIVLKRQPALRQRAAAAVNRAMCIAQRAELSADRHAIDEAEANFRCELASADPKLDPTWWAVCQMALARIYEVRIARAGGDLAGRARALFALSEALEVFSDHGLRDLADVCVTAIDRLQVRRTVGR